MADFATIIGEASWVRMSEGIEKVKARLRRSAAPPRCLRLQGFLTPSSVVMP